MTAENTEPDTDIDISHWGRLARWELEEAAALSLGKDPSTLPLESLKAGNETGDFADQFVKRCREIQRANEMGALSYPFKPRDVVEWADRLGIPFSAPLVNEVIEFAPEHVNWKAEFETLKPKYDQLEGEIERIQSEPNEPTREKPLRTRERETVLKLIIGMATEQYGYDPSASRSETVKNIVSDLELHGLSLDAETVRKWLREAAEILPPKEE